MKLLHMIQSYTHWTHMFGYLLSAPPWLSSLYCICSKTYGLTLQIMTAHRTIFLKVANSQLTRGEQDKRIILIYLQTSSSQLLLSRGENSSHGFIDQDMALDKLLYLNGFLLEVCLHWRTSPCCYHHLSQYDMKQLLTHWRKWMTLACQSLS